MAPEAETQDGWDRTSDVAGGSIDWHRPRSFSAALVVATGCTGLSFTAALVVSLHAAEPIPSASLVRGHAEECRQQDLEKKDWAPRIAFDLRWDDSVASLHSVATELRGTKRQAYLFARQIRREGSQTRYELVIYTHYGIRPLVPNEKGSLMLVIDGLRVTIDPVRTPRQVQGIVRAEFPTDLATIERLASATAVRLTLIGEERTEEALFWSGNLCALQRFVHEVRAQGTHAAWTLVGTWTLDVTWGSGGGFQTTVRFEEDPELKNDELTASQRQQFDGKLTGWSRFTSREALDRAGRPLKADWAAALKGDEFRMTSGIGISCAGSRLSDGTMGGTCTAMEAEIGLLQVQQRPPRPQ